MFKWFKKSKLQQLQDLIKYFLEVHSAYFIMRALWRVTKRKYSEDNDITTYAYLRDALDKAADDSSLFSPSKHYK